MSLDLTAESLSPDSQQLLADYLLLYDEMAKRGIQAPLLPPALMLRYESSPQLYVAEVLGQRWTPDQKRIARSLVRPPYRTMVTSGHSVGKTHLEGGIVNWHVDCRTPSITITTAPSQAVVEQVVWREVRSQRGERPGLAPRKPEIYLNEDHFAVGFTAAKGAAFHGRKSRNMAIIFDEAVDIEPVFWQGARSMLSWPGNLWLACLNPTDTTSQAYQEFTTGDWALIELSCLDHPNVIAELSGRQPPYPGAVSLQFVRDGLKAWCEPVAQGDVDPSRDFEFPDENGNGKWWRPGPEGEARLLGRWPSEGSTSVWSRGAWQLCERRKFPIPQKPLEIGCDVAREGDDFTSIVARRGGCALHHETHNGWGTDRTAFELKELAARLVEPGEDIYAVEIKIDDDGVGGGVIDQAGRFNFVGISGAETPNDPWRYPNRRSEMWFDVAGDGKKGLIDVSRLSEESRRLIGNQLMAPQWYLEGGKRRVEDKRQTKKRLRRSPDDADSFNLAFYSGGHELWVY